MPGGDPPIRVVVADHHTMVAEAFRRALTAEAGIEVVGVAGTVSTAVAAVTSTRADVVVVDEDLPDHDGLDAATQIRRGAPEARVVVLLADRAGPAAVQAAVDAGCVGVLEKTEGLDRLTEVVRAAATGGLAIPLGAVRDLLGRRPVPSGPTLTTREREILRHAAGGLGNRAIADLLGIRLNTVRTHLHRAITKLGTHSRLEAVSRARRLGVLDD